MLTFVRLLLPIISAFLAKSIEQTLYRNLPQLTQDSIRFEDALGRVRLLPYDFFQHWEVRFLLDVVSARG